jgi:hypothetical protein
MSKYFEALVFGHALSQDSFSYRAIRFADVRAIVIISCAAYIFQNLLGLIADEYERLDLSERDDWRASAPCACL